MIELKPCPFCGGEAMFLVKSRTERGITNGYGFGICCEKCGVTTPKLDYRLELNINSTGEIEVTHDERPLAIEAWNRRADNDV